MPTTHLLYLHGFRSSPQSYKARTMAQYVQCQHPSVTWYCPQLPPSPKAAMQMVMAHVQDWPSAQMAVIGSSLGGYYATWVAHQKHCKSVLLNPAVYPDHSLEHHIGQQTSWHNPQEAFFFKPEYIQELRELALHDLATTAPQLGIFAKGDEVLDWRQMAARYPEAEQVILEGGDHAISDFDSHISRILDFLNLA
ncbi:MAG: YqiA/YcfP family alpha/beta fold hydrolase [Comamonas sp.]